MIDAKLTDIVLFSLAVAFTVIGFHQVFVNGLLESYWIFMISFTCLIIYNLRKSYQKAEAEGTEDKDKSKKAIKPTKKKLK
jgi:Ca2+/Na+ antiporter